MEQVLKMDRYLKARSKELDSFTKLHSQTDEISLNLLELLFKDIEGSRLSIGYPAPQYVYGELKTMSEYFKLFSHSEKLKRECVFTDLGSGLGKAVFVIAASFPVSQSIGIEKVPKLHWVCLGQQKIFDSTISPRLPFHPRISFLCGSVENLAENWLYSDVIFLNSLTWRKNVLKKVTKLLETLKEGSEVFTSSTLRSKRLVLVKTLSVEMNWGPLPMYMYIQRGPKQGVN